MATKRQKRPAKDDPFESYPMNTLICPECEEPQRDTPGGASCKNSHGGLQGLTFGELERKKALSPRGDSSTLFAPAYDNQRGKVRIRHVPLLTTRLVELQNPTGEDLTGCIVKATPRVLASKRDEFDADSTRAEILQKGARGVVVTPRIVNDSVPSDAVRVVSKSGSPRDAVLAWFAELRGVSDEDRAAALELALELVEEQL